jgi:D-alanyl-D-alanine carboxypeptidase
MSARRSARQKRIVRPEGNLTAKAYAVVDVKTGRTLLGRNHTASFRVASLTKLCVALTAVRMADEGMLSDGLDEVVSISEKVRGGALEAVQRDVPSLCTREIYMSSEPIV